MSTVLQPLDVKCNIQCHYCYQAAQRQSGNTRANYDLATMKAAVEEAGGPFTLFGGEPLLMPESDVEALFAWGYRLYGESSIQTNGTLVNENHIRLFIQYNVSVGISIDGPEELNDARWAGTIEQTRHETAKTCAAIERLCAANHPPCLIATIHRLNGARGRLPRLCEWLRYLDEIGIRSVRLHFLEVESDFVRDTYSLDCDETIDAFIGLFELEKTFSALRFDLFTAVRNGLLGRDAKSCVWSGCDPYTTAAVQGIKGDGRQGNCGRTNKDGVDFVKASMHGFERSMALYHVPQEYLGCNGCRFFVICRGYCPGTGINGDWRNRTEYCEVLTALYERAEADIVASGQTPLSLSDIRPSLEQLLIDNWASQRNPPTRDVLQQIKTNEPLPIQDQQGRQSDRSVIAGGLPPDSQIGRDKSTM